MNIVTELTNRSQFSNKLLCLELLESSESLQYFCLLCLESGCWHEYGRRHYRSGWGISDDTCRICCGYPSNRLRGLWVLPYIDCSVWWSQKFRVGSWYLWICYRSDRVSWVFLWVGVLPSSVRAAGLIDEDINLWPSSFIKF